MVLQSLDQSTGAAAGVENTDLLLGKRSQGKQHALIEGVEIPHGILNFSQIAEIVELHRNQKIVEQPRRRSPPRHCEP